MLENLVLQERSRSEFLRASTPAKLSLLFPVLDTRLYPPFTHGHSVSLHSGGTTAIRARCSAQGERPSSRSLREGESTTFFLSRIADISMDVALSLCAQRG